MFLKKSIPFTPSMRFTSLVDKRLLSNYKIKFINSMHLKQNGINNEGKKTVRHKGGFKKKKYINLDFFRDSNINIPHKVINICYDAYRSSFIALICSFNGVYSYILSSRGLFCGSLVFNRNNTVFNFSEGDHLFLKNIPFGMFFFNIERINNLGFSLSKSAGTYCQFINKIDDTNKALVRLPSGKRIYISLLLRGTLGTASNIKHRYENIGKAGRNRNKGIRPTVRGVAMNPVDHPHGGGEGKKSGRSCPFSPWRKQPFFKKK